MSDITEHNRKMREGHTPTPECMTLPLHNDGGPFIKDAVGRFICRMTELNSGDVDTGRCDPNSERWRAISFIVRAVNAHDDLLSTLKLARKALKSALAKEGYEWIGDDCIAIDAAIAKVEGK